MDVKKMYQEAVEIAFSQYDERKYAKIFRKMYENWSVFKPLETVTHVVDNPVSKKELTEGKMHPVSNSRTVLSKMIEVLVILKNMKSAGVWLLMETCEGDISEPIIYHTYQDAFDEMKARYDELNDNEDGCVGNYLNYGSGKVFCENDETGWRISFLPCEKAINRMIGKRYYDLEAVKGDLECLTGNKVLTIMFSETEKPEECDDMIDYEFETGQVETMYYLKDNSGKLLITEI